MDIDISLLEWVAWAPNIETSADWHVWANSDGEFVDTHEQPHLSFVPALARRRMSRLTRMALHVAEACRGEHASIHTIFASRHGELIRTMGILEDIVSAHVVSPAAFSVSVHNTASGLYTIEKKDHSPSTAMSAGIDTLEMAMVEAYGQLKETPTKEILLVMADDVMPKIYGEFIDERERPFALALRLGLNGERVLRLQHKADVVPVTLPHTLMLLKLLCGVGDGRWGSWQWTV